MAFIDAALDTIVIRIVYDGPPLAGKTTSVRALAGGMGGMAQSPAELDGRTVYFDWLEYTGGLFEGRRIRCQIVSVPGQTMLASRRRYLLESADSVVFVADSTPASEASMVGYLKALRTVLAHNPGPAVGIVVQANHRDRPDAVPVGQLRAALAAAQVQVGVIESVATDGAGVRETFIFAVRLALDRVRELMQLSALQRVHPHINSAQELLADMQSVENKGLALATAEGLTLIRPIQVAATALVAQALREAAPDPVGHPRVARSQLDATSALPRLPDSTLPSGMIWPPVNGRLVLDNARQGVVSPQKDALGDWTARALDDYLFHSPGDARYAHLDQGRNALIHWARMHTASTSVISAERCIVLAEDGSGHYRLWQVIRADRSLRDMLHATLIATAAGDVEAIARVLLVVCERFVEAAEAWASAACTLPLEMMSIGAGPPQPRYVGKMPVFDAQDAHLAHPFSQEQLLEALLKEDLNLDGRIRPDQQLALAQAVSRLAQSAARNASAVLLRQFAAHYAEYSARA